MPYAPPVKLEIHWTECGPDMLCIAVNHAAALLVYLEADARWHADYDALCTQKDS